MPTPVFFTVDTELVWRHHASGLDAATIIQRSLEPAGVGISWQLAQLRAHGLKASFFVDPMPALVYGLDPLKRVVAAILEAGQEVQLHLHPNWTGARFGDGGASHSSFELIDYSRDEQIALVKGATDMLVAAGAAEPIAFRSGSYSASDDTLAALAQLGFIYDSSHNGSQHPWPSAISLPAKQISPIVHHDIIEVPVTLIEDRPGQLRHFQICALSSREMRAALDHAMVQNHAAVTIVSHSFELANRSGTRANAVHVKRFIAVCELLAERKAVLATRHFAERPHIVLGQSDVPLGPNPLRTRLRQVQQIWSNFIEERKR